MGRGGWRGAPGEPLRRSGSPQGSNRDGGCSAARPSLVTGGCSAAHPPLVTGAVVAGSQWLPQGCVPPRVTHGQAGEPIPCLSCCTSAPSRSLPTHHEAQHSALSLELLQNEGNANQCNYSFALSLMENEGSGRPAAARHSSAQDCRGCAAETCWHLPVSVPRA